MGHLRTLVLACLIWAASTSPTQADEVGPSRANLAGQFVAGLLGTGLGFLGGGLLGASLGGTDDSEYDEIGQFVVGGLVGVTLLTAAGVHRIGSTHEVEGSMGSTWVGAVVGTLGAVSWFAGTESSHPALTSMGIAFPTLGAMYAFQSSRHLRVQPATEGGVEVSLHYSW